MQGLDGLDVSRVSLVSVEFATGKFREATPLR